jgi:hypothetical protein
VLKAESGKTKISIRLENRILDHFRAIVETAGEGKYRTLINDAWIAYIRRTSMLEAVRQVVREEVAGSMIVQGGGCKPPHSRARRVVAVA